jgi:hypothetical protein
VSHSSRYGRDRPPKRALRAVLPVATPCDMLGHTGHSRRHAASQLACLPAPADVTKRDRLRAWLIRVLWQRIVRYPAPGRAALPAPHRKEIR